MPDPATFYPAMVTEMHRLEGWCWPEKALALAELIIAHKPNLVVEIGVFGGKSLIPQAMALRFIDQGGMIYGIDPWMKSAAIEGLDLNDADDQRHYEWWTTHVNLEAIQAGCAAAIERLGLWSHCALIRGRSERCGGLAGLFEPESIGVLHIDGCHQTEIAQRDVRTYLPLVQRNGFIWFDDADWPSVQPALKLLDAECDLVRDYGKFRLYIRR